MNTTATVTATVTNVTNETYGNLTKLAPKETTEAIPNTRDRQKWETDLKQHTEQVEKHPQQWNGKTAMVQQIAPLGKGELAVTWHESTFAELKMRVANNQNTSQRRITADITVGIAMLVWVQCDNGWVASQRAAHLWGGGQWTASTMEGIEPRELRDLVLQKITLADIANRAVQEELGIPVTDITTTWWQQAWHAGWETRLYATCRYKGTIDDIQNHKTTAVGGKEISDMNILDQLPDSAQWWPSLLKPTTPQA